MGLLNEREGGSEDEDEGEGKRERGANGLKGRGEARSTGTRTYPVHAADICIMLLFFPIAVSDNEHSRARRNYYAFRYIEYISIAR